MVDGLDAELEELVALAGTGGPVGVGALDDDAAEVRKLVEQPLDGTEAHVLVIDQDCYLRLTHAYTLLSLNLPRLVSADINHG